MSIAVAVAYDDDDDGGGDDDDSDDDTSGDVKMWLFWVDDDEHHVPMGFIFLLAAIVAGNIIWSQWKKGIRIMTGL